MSKNGHFLAHKAKFGQNENFSQKGLCYLFTLIVPQLHAKFQKNPWSSFRDQLRDERTLERTDKGDIIEPVAFAGSIKNQRVKELKA